MPPRGSGGHALCPERRAVLGRTKDRVGAAGCGVCNRPAHPPSSRPPRSSSAGADSCRQAVWRPVGEIKFWILDFGFWIGRGLCAARWKCEHRTSNIEHRTSNIEHPTSNRREPREKDGPFRLLFSPLLFDVGCSMFNVRCSHSFFRREVLDVRRSYSFFRREVLWIVDWKRAARGGGGALWLRESETRRGGGRGEER